MLKNREIDHTNLVVPNFEIALKWYKELGYEVKGHFIKDGFEIYYISNNIDTLELFENPSLSSSVVDHVAYKSTDLQKDYDYLKSLGCTMLTNINYIDFTWDNGADYFLALSLNNQKIEFIKVR